MADVAATEYGVAHGLSDWNHRLVAAQGGSVPDGDTLVCDFSAYLLTGEGPTSQPMVPYSMTVTSVGAGSVGSRTHTARGEVACPWTYDESTGIVRVTNSSGAARDLRVSAIFGPITA
jgi:hypothetical protein